MGRISRHYTIPDSENERLLVFLNFFIALYCHWATAQLSRDCRSLFQDSIFFLKQPCRRLLAVMDAISAAFQQFICERLALSGDSWIKCDHLLHLFFQGILWQADFEAEGAGSPLDAMCIVWISSWGSFRWVATCVSIFSCINIFRSFSCVFNSRVVPFSWGLRRC